MEHPEEHYYKLNRLLLSVIGLCPYQSKWSARLTRTVIMVILLSSIFFQISSLFTFDINVDFIVDGIPTFILVMGNLIHICLRIMHVDKFRELFERMSKDWALQKTHNEIKIMHERAEISRLFTLYFLILSYINVVGYSTWMFVPEILDIISPMNESRPRMQPFNAEFFIDEERYFYLIRFHMCLVLFIMPITFLACSTLFLTLTQHVCGMCELLGFIDLIETCHEIPLLMDIIAIVIMMSLTLTTALSVTSTETAIRSIGMTTSALIYGFMSCYMGQKVTDVSSSVCEKIFNSTWYNEVVSVQKALLIIIMRRYRPLILTACKFYVMSLQNFGRILQTAISYCMFVRQF